MNVIDLKPLIDGFLIPIVQAVMVPLLATAVSWALYKVGQVAHVTLDQKNAQILETAMQNGINFALSKAQTFADAHGTVAVKSTVIAQAVNYVLPKVPDALTKLGITPQGLAERIEARLPQPPNASAAVGIG